MKCPKCQFENQEDATFCNECGNKLEIDCPGCGKTNLPGSKFCKGCGHDLRKPTDRPPIDYSKPRSYTPKFLADKILTTRSSIEGERKVVTVLFADVANYTSIAEKLDPEEAHQILDGCFKILMDEIHRYEGTINQFTGDGVIALFGAPLAHEDHAQRACHAALAIQKTIGGYGGKITARHGAEFKMRIGLNSGPVVRLVTPGRRNGLQGAMHQPQTFLRHGAEQDVPSARHAVPRRRGLVQPATPGVGV